ncbi:conserved hypothetical protein [Trichinella spiralis]|uniref:hypothetical protein n=1 Tax=Trichinella spiralis TaxID=6334 RepID=UPI0001EFC8E0|nr:conserved hypothetical protein [Trichinella spiralis]
MMHKLTIDVNVKTQTLNAQHVRSFGSSIKRFMLRERNAISNDESKKLKPTTNNSTRTIF